MKVALLTEVAAPYRLPLLRALAERVELRVFFLGRVDPRRSYPPPAGNLGFAWEVLPGRHLVPGERWVALNHAVGRRLRAFGPDVVIVGGWNQPAFWLARTLRSPVVCWVESTLADARGDSRLGGLLKRRFLRGCAAVLVPGRAAAGYAASLGVPGERIVLAPNAVQQSHVPCLAPDVARGAMPQLLYAGRLAPEKGLEVLLRAVEGLDVELEVAGDGERPASAPANVRFIGWVDPEEMPEIYARADVFVLPSLSEPWGMVLNEAAAAGLPLVASDAAGAAHELIEDGVNGFVVPAGDADALREALRKLVDDPQLRASAGARSRELALEFTPERWAESVAALARRLARA